MGKLHMDQHKILETELKMLYTAITRARVNIFIAETNTDQVGLCSITFKFKSIVSLMCCPRMLMKRRDYLLGV